MWFCFIQCLDIDWSEKMKFPAILGRNLWPVKLCAYPHFILLLHFKWVQDSIATLTWGFEYQTHEFANPYSLLPLFWMQLMRTQLIKHWFIGLVLENCCDWVFSVSYPPMFSGSLLTVNTKASICWKELNACMNYLLLMNVDGCLGACKEEFRCPL